MPLRTSIVEQVQEVGGLATRAFPKIPKFQGRGSDVRAPLSGMSTCLRSSAHGYVTDQHRGVALFSTIRDSIVARFFLHTFYCGGAQFWTRRSIVEVL